MPNYLLLFFLLFGSLLHASEIELYADSVESNASHATACGNTLLIKNDMMIKADVIDLDKRSHIIEAYGNIFIDKENYAYTLSDYIYMDMDNNYTVLDKFFYMSTKESLWISSAEAKRQANRYRLKGALTSTCNPEDPDWTIGFSSGYYDQEDEWIDLYNPIVYAGRVPVFYFPYLGIPTSTKRRSGLLNLKFGVSNKEGYLLRQPVYLAPQEWWDVTITPEVRSKRGNGMLAELRVADSPHSQGSLEIGKFEDYEKYTRQEQLQNSAHTGVTLKYRRDRLLSDESGESKDSLFLHYVNVNDVDYLSIQEREATQTIPSKLNYLFYTPKHYIGLNAKYFIDTTQPTNDATIQILPQLHYHANSDSVIFDNMLYSVDYKNKQYEREKGLTASDHSVTVPLSYAFSLFDDYLNVLMSENLYFYRIDYQGSQSDKSMQNGYENSGQVHKDNLYMALFTDMAKGYESFFHNINLSAGYTHINSYHQSGYFDNEFVAPTEGKDTVALKFSQFFLHDSKPVVVHRLNQSFVLEADDNVSKSDLENEVVVNLARGLTFNSLIAIGDKQTISKATHMLRLTRPDYAFSLNSIVEIDTKTNKATTDYYTVNGMVRPYQAHAFSANYSYDKVYDTTRGYGVEYMLNKNCWDFSVSYTREITPYLSNGSVNSTINDIIYLKINLNPFWGFEQKAYEYERDG